MRQTQLANGAITLPAPAGFCIDPRSVRRGSNNSFAVMASCAALGAGPDFDASVITVTVSPPHQNPENHGLAALKRATQSQGILSQRSRDSVAVVQLANGGNTHIKKAAAKHWRATFVVNQRIVGLAAFGAPDAAMVRDAGGHTLENLAQSIRNQSPTLSTNGKITAKPQAAADTNEKKGLGRVIGRLFQRNHLAKQ